VIDCTKIRAVRVGRSARFFIEKQIPCGNNGKKDKGNRKSKVDSNSRSFVAMLLRMTNLRSMAMKGVGS
jgi:hypothetical protein